LAVAEDHASSGGFLHGVGENLGVGAGKLGIGDLVVMHHQASEDSLVEQPSHAG
jgi:hypothetical protein